MSLNCKSRQVLLGAIAALGMMPPTIAQPPVAVPQVSADDYYEHGLSRYAQRDWEGAISAFTQAIQINPGDRDAYYRRGFAHCKLGVPQAANSDFRHSSAFHPPAFCLNGVLRVNSSGMGFQPDPGELERKGYELLESGNIEQSVQVLRSASIIFRAQGEMLRYRKVQQTLGKLMRH